METFYFTYGTSGHPFVGGWTKIEAPNAKAACALFRIFHPDKTEGLLNCASVYSEDSFFKTVMPKVGNLGRFAHERISVTRELYG